MLISKTQNLILKTRISGQSVIEVIVAVAIFTMIAASAVVTILGSFSTTRLAEEESYATHLAVEGIEVAQSIRNQGWNNLTDGGHGVSKLGGVWEFSGTSDTVDDRYTRVVNVVTIDDDTKEITSTINWDFTTARQNSVEIVTRLARWQTAIGQTAGGTPTPTPTDSPTPTPTDSPVGTCNEYCINALYSSGTCRKNAKTCRDNGETYESEGDQYCTGGPSSDTCCCAP